jgi:flagellar motor protein MotB
MEKGFNEDELADIMSEIESLEQDFATETAEPQQVSSKQEDAEPQQEEVEHQPEEVVAKEQHEEPQAEDSSQSEEWQESKVEPIQSQQEEDETEVDEEMNEVLDELSHMPVEDVTPKHTQEDDNIHHFKGEAPMSNNTGKSQTAMSFHVEGDMKLELSFHIGDQFIGVNITEEGLVVGLDGGAKFTIPVQQQSQKKAA